MGIETVVKCDTCNKDLTGTDYVTIEAKYEMDMNYSISSNDIRRREFGVFCEEHGKEVWSGIQTNMSITRPKRHD